MTPLQVVQGVKFLVEYHARLKKERLTFRSRIETEGGVIHSVRRVSWFFRNPFRNAHLYPLIHWFVVTYGGRTGSWFIATSDDKPDGIWVWKDENGIPDLPIMRTADARVDNRVIALGFVASILLSNGILVGLVCLLLWFIRSRQ